MNREKALLGIMESRKTTTKKSFIIRPIMTKSFHFIVDEVTFQLYDDLMPIAIKKRSDKSLMFFFSPFPSTSSFGDG